METILLFAFLAGLDNLHVAAAIGLSGVNSSRKWFLAGQFSLWEAAMPFAGLLLGFQIHTRLGEYAGYIGPAVLFLCGLTILYQVIREQDTDEAVNGNFALFALPFALSIDNLFAGVGLGANGYPVTVSAICIGLVSGSMCFIGMFLGGWVRKWIPGKVEALSGVYLIFLAGFMLAGDEGLALL